MFIFVTMSVVFYPFVNKIDLLIELKWASPIHWWTKRQRCREVSVSSAILNLAELNLHPRPRLQYSLFLCWKVSLISQPTIGTPVQCTLWKEALFVAFKGAGAWYKDTVCSTSSNSPTVWGSTTRTQWICNCPRTSQLPHWWGCSCKVIEWQRFLISHW